MDGFDLRSDAVGAALAEARAAYVDRNPLSAAAHARAEAVMPGGNTRSVLFYEPFPLVMARGEGCFLWDADGHCYLDLLGEFTAGLFGHSNPVIRAAIDTALDAGWSFGAHNLMEPELARLICDRFASIDRLRFTNSGTEANLMALAAAKAFTGRSRILVFKGGYHGGVLTFAAGQSPANVPHDIIFGDYNDAESVRRLIAENAGDLAAVLVEPMMGAGGCIPGEPAFLATIQAAAQSVGRLVNPRRGDDPPAPPAEGCRRCWISRPTSPRSASISAAACPWAPSADAPMSWRCSTPRRPGRAAACGDLQQQRADDGGRNRRAHPRSSRRRPPTSSVRAATASATG